MPRGVKEWSTDPIRDLVEALDEDTVDSSRLLDEESRQRAEAKMRGAASPLHAGGGFWAIHVTDDPGPMLEAIREGRDLEDVGGAWLGGMACPGMHLTNAPQYWVRARSARRYDFLETLSAEAREALRRIILDDLRRKRASGYITEPEFENAVRHVEEGWIGHGNWRSLFTVIDQPYNVDVPAMAKEAGLASPAEPQAVPVLFVGRYLSFMKGETQREADRLAELTFPGTRIGQKEVCEALRRHGWDGVFTTSGFSTEPQLFVMNPAKILRFGDWTRPGSGLSMSGVREEGVWIGGVRFEAEIPAGSRRASILDRHGYTRFREIDAEGMRELRRTLDQASAAMQGEGALHAGVGRFEASVSRGRTHAGVKDLEASGRTTFGVLSRAALEELRELVYTLQEYLEAGEP